VSLAVTGTVSNSGWHRRGHVRGPSDDSRQDWAGRVPAGQRKTPPPRGPAGEGRGRSPCLSPPGPGAGNGGPAGGGAWAIVRCQPECQPAQGGVKVIPKMFNILNLPTGMVDASDSQLHQDYTIDSAIDWDKCMHLS
jgi:hypothetical protein